MVNSVNCLFRIVHRRPVPEKPDPPVATSPVFTKQSSVILEHKDIEFEVEGKKIGASRVSLCMLSPVLEKIMKGHSKEAALSMITLPGKSFNAFVEFIEVTHLQKNITSGNVYDILPLIHEYSCSRLLTQCEIVLMDEPVSLKLYYLADKYGLRELYSNSLSKLQQIDYSIIMEEEEDIYKSLKDKAKIVYLEAMLQSLR